jgi:uncharacterized membrane protein
MMDIFVRSAATALEAAGALTILIGVAVAAVTFLSRIWRAGGEPCYRRFRADLGRSILLGLELLVAADILNSLIIDPTLADLSVLAGIVLIRTFLSMALEVEINGHWPWEGARLARQGAAPAESSRAGAHEA